MRRRRNPHGRRDPSLRTIRAIARKGVIANGRAEASSDEIALLARCSVQQDENFVRGCMRDDIVTTQVASDELYDLLPQRCGVAIITRRRQRQRAIRVHFDGEYGQWRAAGGSRGNSRLCGVGKFSCRRQLRSSRSCGTFQLRWGLTKGSLSLLTL